MPPRRRGAPAGGDPALLRFLRSIEKLTGENSRASRRRDERAIEVLQCELYREAGSSSAPQRPRTADFGITEFSSSSAKTPVSKR